MKVNAKIKSSFVHGNKPYAPGEEAQFTKAEANDMEKSGLIEIGEEVTEDQQIKMEAEPDNKMAEAPANKSRPTKAK